MSTALTETHTIDATGKRLGRLATEVATILMGKHRADCVKHQVVDVQVTVENASKLVLDERKLQGKRYDRYSGYPGGRTEETMAQVIEKKGYSEVVRKAVRGMLPSNRLRAPRMKRLTVTD
jgi:large subunit ribosomal protein L13